MHAHSFHLQLDQSNLARHMHRIRRMRPVIVRALGVAAGFSLLLLIVSVDPAHAQSRAALHSDTSDPRLREVWYDPHEVVTVPVKRGIVTHVLLDAGEVITEVGSGQGSDCNKPEASWCIAAQTGGRSLFVKPKSSASAPNNLAVITNLHTHALRFVVLNDNDARQPVYRLVIRSPQTSVAVASSNAAATLVPPALLGSPDATTPAIDEPTSDELVTKRLAAAPVPSNSHYTLAEGRGSQDIVPTLVFDDGRFTYLRFPNNREVPAVFQVQGDGLEALVNTRMDGDLLVVDRVSRRLMLRAGSAVVGIWNEAFDLDGRPALDANDAHTGTTVSGVRRALKANQTNEMNPSSASGERP